MKERPILFSTNMVRAILNGNKTQTRRIVKPAPPAYVNFQGIVSFSTNRKNVGKAHFCRGKFPCVRPPHIHICNPFGVQGDCLWVKETFGYDPFSARPGHNEIVYKADNIDPDYPVTWKPSIHMPKKHARIWLDVVVVRVERLQDISMEDVEQEGIWPPYRRDFEALWDLLNKKRGFGWCENPWVWVVEFRVTSMTGRQGVGA